MKLIPSYLGKNNVWRFLRRVFWVEYFDFRRREKWGASFLYFIKYYKGKQIKKKIWVGQILHTGIDEKYVQNFSKKIWEEGEQKIEM